MIPTVEATPASSIAVHRLGHRPRGWSGCVTGFAPMRHRSLAWGELERRLLEIGIVEGARIEVLHEGPIGRDPIAIRVDDTTVALRRRDADAVLVAAAE